jgi:hypothetical protein
MSQRTLLGDSAPSEEISKTEATASRRVYSRRLKLVRRTADCDCSSSHWTRPRAREDNDYYHDNNSLTLTGQAKMWTTPTAGGPHPRASGQSTTSKGPPFACLHHDSIQFQLLGTPSASDTKGGDAAGRLATKGYLKGRAEQGFQPENLASAPNPLPTRTGLPSDPITLNGNAFLKRIASALRHSRGRISSETLLRNLARSRQAGMRNAVCKRKLAPQFVEWLMGLPDGMTGCGPVEMESFRLRQQWLLSIYFQRLLNINVARSDAPPEFPQ